jgi:hypothetical protein
MSLFPFPTRCLSLLLLSAGMQRTECAEVTVKDRAALAGALQKAVPGTVIRVAPGTYAGGISASGVAGTKTQPVVLTAADPAQPPVIEGGASGIQLSGCSFIELSHLHFSGATANGINVDDGGSGKPAAQGIALRHLKVTNNAPRGNRDGIKLSGLREFTVENCRVERWGLSGSGIDMVGCHSGVVANSEFKHDGPAAGMANGVQMKGGSSDITVQRCRFIDSGGRGVNLGGHTGAEYFRPLGSKAEAASLTVEDCLFSGVQAPVAFVGVDGAVVRHNTIYRPGRWVLRILQENTGADMVKSRNGSFTSNLIVFQSTSLREAVNIGGGTEPATFQFEGNTWHCEDRPADTKRLIRLPSPEKGGHYDKTPKFTAEEDGDFTLTPDSPVKNAGMRPEKKAVK